MYYSVAYKRVNFKSFVLALFDDENMGGVVHANYAQMRQHQIAETIFNKTEQSPYKHCLLVI